MLSHLRRHAAETIAPARRAVLSTFGPADIQMGDYACEAAGLRLYMVVPMASDNLFNLESHSQVVVLGEGWRLHGTGQRIDAAQAPSGLGLVHETNLNWAALIEIRPSRLDIEARGCVQSETIDIDEP